MPNECVTQIEEYLDNPQMITPLVLAQSIGKPTERDEESYEQHKRLAWRCFYLLALFPPELRADALTCQPDQAILKHFHLVAHERKQARSRLIEGTLRYVLRTAMSYLGRGLPYLDLVQEGYFGLQCAADRFIEQEGGHFQQYAGQWIQQRILLAIAAQSRPIRLPVHLSERLMQLKKIEREFENALMVNPYACDQAILERLKPSTASKAVNNPHKAAIALRRLRKTDARHYSYDLDVFAEFLVDETSFEEQFELRLLMETINRWLEQLSERERKIVRLRTGLADGEAKTLEEIGQLYGVTRERVRQIEARARRKMTDWQLKYAFKDISLETDHRIETAINDLWRPLMNVLDHLDRREALQPDAIQKERRWIERRVKKRVARRERRMPRKRRCASRVRLFSQVLSEAGHPLHYAEVHQRALALLPPEQHFIKESVYAALFQSDDFRLLGGGVFSLAAWQNRAQETSCEPILAHCPTPLLPVHAPPRAFLESIMMARQLVQAQPEIAIRQFYEAMLARAGRDWSDPQDAFDAWYAAGLHDYIQFAHQAREPIRLSIPPTWKLAEVCVHGLNHVCRRIQKMPELLAALDRLGSAEIPRLQKLLFGSAGAGFDVPLRLNMLAAFEAVRADGNQWRITELGRAALQANPPQELPDFGVIKTPEPDEPDTDDGDDHLAIVTL